MKKTIYENISYLDARNLTPEAAQGIESISNTAFLLVSEQSAQLLSGIEMSNISSTLLMKDEMNLVHVNGQHIYTAGGSTQNLYLMINGQLTFDQSVTAVEIASAVVGGVVNGQAIGSASQISAMTQVGVMVNGQSVIYPDGARLRKGNTPLTPNECMMIPENSKLYILKRVMLEAGSAEILHSRNIKIDCHKQLFVAKSDAALMSYIYDGDPSRCIIIPDGFTLRQSSLTVTRQNALTLQGSLCIYGSVYIHEVNPAHLSRLEALHITGKIYVPVDQMDLWIPLIQGEPEWIPYEGTLQLIDGVATIGALTAPKTIINHGVATLSPELTSELLQKNMKLIINDGVLNATPAQITALGDVMISNGQINTLEDESDASSKPRDPSFNYISNIAMYVL
ncbi:MAG: hypothetical protein GX096_05760 [Clostridiales bacterium]|nr:hypothetical protein [Clostridiales bacterium]